MSKDEFDTHLKFGQGILIQGFKTIGNDTGFLTAQGFADIKAKYQTYDDLLYFKNYRNSIFQILPAGNFELNDQLQKALIQNQGQEDTSNIKILKARAESQKYQFELNCKNNQKKKICFGQNVIFKHIDSKSYVSGTIKPSTGSNGAFTVQVSNKLSESLVFKLLPYRSFEFLDMPIPFDSPILIRNGFNNGFLTFQKIGIGDQGRSKGTYIEKKPIQSNETYRIPVKTQSQKSDIYEVVTHFVDLSVEKQVPMPWRFKLHVNEVINDTLIQHDVVYLKHTQNNGVLSIYGSNIILKESKQNSGDELKFYECLWEIQKHNEDAYILRHLMSGMILAQQQRQGGLRRPLLQDLSAGKQQNSQINGIHIRLARKEGGDIGSGSYVNIAWNDQLLQTHDDDELLQQSAAKTHDIDTKIDLAKMRILFKKESNFNIRTLAFKKSIKQEHCFVINEIQDELKQQLLFALSFHSVIIKLRQDLQWGAIEAAKKIGYLRMMQVTYKIRQIKIFIKKCSEEQAQSQHIFPVVQRQMICKDLGISELLFQLLYFMKMNLKEDIFSDKHNQKQKFLQLYNTIYEVIIELIRSNKQFKMHISKWFQFILDDVILNNQACQFNLIRQLLKDNTFFVNNFVNKQIIQYLTSFFFHKSDSKEYYQKKYIQIFRKFCIVDNKVNTFNQKLIIDHFHKKLIEVKSQYMIQIVKVDDSIIVSTSIDKSNLVSLTFEEFHQKCMQENQSAWDYFVEYLNLTADLVQGRNKITEEEITKLFSLDLLGDLFEHYNLYQAQIPIIRLIHYLYAQSQYYYPIERKRRILKFNELSGPENVIIHSTTSIIKPWEPPFDRILLKLQSKIKTQYEAINPDPSQYMKNQTLLNLLKFLWQTLNLGFWYQKDRLRQILSNVLKILNKHPDIVYQQVMKASKDNILMIACKMECLNIIDLISQLDNDIFLQIIANKFKSYQFPDKVFSLKGISSSNLLQIKCDHQMVHNYISELPDEIFIQPIIETNICEQLIEISNYHNPQLTSKAICIMDRILQTRKNVFNQFSSLILISEEQRQKLLQFMEQHRNKFFILEDSNIVNVSEDNQACNYYMVSDPEKLGLMEVLYLLTELMKNQNNVLQIQKIKSIHESGIFEALGTDKLINFTGQRSSTSRMKQQIIYSTNLHTKIINYIFACQQIPEQSLAVKLLHLSYYFIVSLIENFNQIKVLMQGFIPHIMHHIKKNVGCIDFLKEMYDNNKTMLYNEPIVFQLIQQICVNIQSQSDESFYKSKLLDFFRFLIYCNGRALKNHQIQILKIMQDDSYVNIMIKFDKSDLAALIAEYEEQNQGSSQIIMSPKLTYLSTFFQIMASLIDTDNKVNISKLIKRYPFDTLVDFIVQCKSCWSLKRNIRSFLNRLYYFRPQIDDELKCILSRQFSNIIQDLDLYIKLKLSPENAQFQNKKFMCPVRFTYIQSYHYLLLEQILFAVYRLTSGTIAFELIKYFNNFAKTDIEASYNFIKIAQRIGYLQIYFTQQKNIYTNSLIKFILAKLKLMLISLDNKLIYQKALQVDANDEFMFKNAKQPLISKICEGKIGKFYQEKDHRIQQSLPLSYYLLDQPIKQSKIQKFRDDNKLKEVLRNIFKRQKRSFANQDQRISYNLGKLVSSIKLSPQAQKYFLNEYEQKVETYYLREDKYAYIGRIIQLNSRDSLALTPDRKLFFLQYIIGLVQLANKPKKENADSPVEQIPVIEPQQAKPQGQPEQLAFKVDIDQWAAEDWNANEKQIIRTQKELKSCKLGKFIVELLKQDIQNNIQLANSILLCAIAYLLGGNELTQKDILEQLDKDADNQVFGNIQALMINLGKIIRKNIDESQVKQQIDAQFLPETVDNYDFYDIHQKYALRKNVFEPNSTDEFIYNKLCITTYRRTFKFLQLLCENNNKDGKHFIRSQPAKAKQYNFINITTKQLRNLFQIYCDEIKQVPLFLMDFILEVTQIPIYQNQEALMSSSFFEDLCQLKNNFTSNPLLLSQRGFSSTSSIEQIYHKSFSIILSNFQGNSQKTFEIIDGKLQSKFLIEILKEKLTAMNITNREELIKHINDYSNQNNESGGKNTGFDEDMLILLNINIIFLKIKNALGQKSRIYTNYDKFKKQVKEEYKLALQNKLRDEHIEGQALDQKLNEGMAEYKCMYSYLDKCLLNIQITDDKGKDQFIYFPKYPVFKSLSGNLRDLIMKDVNRASHRDKIVSLLSYTRGVKQKMEYSYNLKKQKNITEDNMNDSYKIASSISILLCIFIGFFYHVAIQYQTAEYYTQFTIEVVRFGMSFLQLVFSILYLFYWLQLKLWYNPEALATHVQGQEEPTQSSAEEVQPQQQAQVPAPRWIDLPWRKKLQTITSYLLEKSALIKEQLETQDQRIYKNIQLWRNLIFVGSSIVGTFYFPPMFFLHLIDIFAQNQTLGTILYSAIYNFKSLFLVSIMGVFFTFIFCTVTFSNYMKDIYSAADDIEDMCDGVLACVTQLYVGGAIGQTMQDFEIIRFIYDIIYFTFFEMMFGNIVSGLMLDAFSSLREQADALQSDKKNCCYICNISRQAMEKQGQQFQQHVKNKHFLWNYIFYIYVLQEKDETDYTGIEYYIRLQYYKSNQEKEVSWIPDKGSSEYDVESDSKALSEQLKGIYTQKQGSLAALEQSIKEFKKIAKPYLE